MNTTENNKLIAEFMGSEFVIALLIEEVGLNWEDVYDDYDSFIKAIQELLKKKQ